MSEITAVIARESSIARNPTVEVEVQTATAQGRAAVPSGWPPASTKRWNCATAMPSDTSEKGQQAVRNVEIVLAGRRRHGRARSERHRPHPPRRRRNTDESKLAQRAPGVSMAWLALPRTPSVLPLWRYLGGVSARTLPTPLMNILNGGLTPTTARSARVQ